MVILEVCSLRRIFILLLIISLAILFAMCLFLTTSQASDIKSGSILTFGAENEFAGFEVLKSGSRMAINGSIAANTIMEPLFRMDDNDELIPALGLSAALSDDGKLWTITLRKGVVFHDGTPFNADAVVDHWSRMLDPKNKFPGRLAMSVISSVEKKGDDTVLFRLKHDWLPFKKGISSSRGLMGLIPSPKAVAEGYQDRSPVGTGPFRFKEWISGEKFVVEKNPDYWKKGTPLLEAIVFKPIPDSQTRYAGLKGGQLDMIWTDIGNIINNAGKDDTLEVYESNGNGAEIFILNTRVPPLNDIRVRQALAHANNQEYQVKIVYDSSIPIVHHPFGTNFKCENDGYRNYNPEKAKKLLSGVSAPLELECLHSNSGRGREIGEITQQLMKEVGVNIKPLGLNFGPVIQKVMSGDYQISTWRILSMADQGASLYRAFHSESKGNNSGYKNPEMDALLNAQAVETDPLKRDAILCDIARLINRDVPIIYRGGMRDHIIAKKTVVGVSSFSHGVILFNDVLINR